MAITEHAGITKQIDGIPLTPKDLVDIGPQPTKSVEEERLERKQKLAGALRIFGRLGFGEGVAGHITVRDPEFPDHFWVNPFARSFRLMRVSDLILVNHDGDVVYGNHPVNRAAFCIHAAIHKARPDVVSAAQQGGAVVFETAAGEEIAEKFPSGKAAIHQNHGLFTVAPTVDAAAYWFLSLERTCMAQIMAESVGTPKLIPHEMATYTRDLTAHPVAGWLNFQPLWQEICRTDPDLFD